jgi:hypothetical protein
MRADNHGLDPRSDHFQEDNPNAAPVGVERLALAPKRRDAPFR